MYLCGTSSWILIPESCMLTRPFMHTFTCPSHLQAGYRLYGDAAGAHPAGMACDPGGRHACAGGASLMMGNEENCHLHAARLSSSGDTWTL